MIYVYGLIALAFAASLDYAWASQWRTAFYWFTVGLVNIAAYLLSQR